MIDRQKLGFIYTVEHLGIDGKVKSVEKVENIIPVLGVNYILSAALKAGAQYSTWYIGLFTANRSPVPSDTMETFLADCAESAAYGGTTRLEAVLPAVENGLITSQAAPALFSFASAATIMGGFITSGVTIGNTSGLLISAVKFSSPKGIAAGESLRVPVGIALASV